jgi:hypothetical protein
MSIVVLGLIVNTASFSDLAFADKPDQKAAKEAREDAKKDREDDREKAKKDREDDREKAKKDREDMKEEREDIKEFDDSIIVTSSSSSSTDKVTICHSPPGNPSNAHTITIGSPAARAHLANHSGDSEGSCGEESEDSEELKAEKESRLAEKLSEKESNALERAEKLIEKLEQQISNLEERLQSLLEKYESGEYYGNISTVDTVTNSYVISFEGIASSIYDESETTDMSGELFMENQVTTSDTSKFKITSGEVIVGTDIYDVAFGKARGSSSGPSGEDNSMVVILQTIDSEENDNTIKIILGFDSPLEGEFGNPAEEFEILDGSKISGQWILDGNGQLSLE